MYGVPNVRCEAPPGEHGSLGPFWYVHLPNEQVAAAIVARAVLIRGIFELWGEGSSFEEMGAAVAALPAATKAPYCGPDTSFKVVLDAWGHSWSEEQQQQMIDRCPEFLPSQGRVELRAPQQTFWLACARLGGANGLPASEPRWYFGRQVALADRSWVKGYALPRRAYIGPTSMDPEVAFLMTNLAQVRRSSLVLDPYVGTGSILIAAAARGAHTMGCDIDVRVLKHGRKCPKTGRQVDIYSNYEQYGLQYPVGLLRMDVHTHPFREGMGEVFSAILGDPPYGVRAGGRKLVAKSHAIRHRSSHIPSTEPYSLTECLADLLELAAATLVTGGRLVFFMPASPETYKEDQLPCHPMLAIASNVEQPLQSRYSRRLVTMVKVKPYDPVVAAQFKESRKDFVMDIDRLHDIVYATEQQQQQQGDGGGSVDGSSEGSSVVKVKAKYRSKMC
ncbi:hypothetical protein OEZ85_011255 [Tetradesmus obliquus]|uniref:tRNA (guanine(10)-N(2))-methyltransferase n=1 Tax=Tetradesmus obliquus TaxID=3088 RepID=A0ABY8TPR1_TETOB|nr:hypothetical protein OEZ85_011255 [Tetradesmus obliquus]